MGALVTRRQLPLETDGPERPQPGFVWSTQVFFDELDAMGMLHNARYLVLVERASSAFFESKGWRWQHDPARNPDQHYAVREQSVRYLEPILSPGEVAIELWVERLGHTSATYGFAIRSADGAHLFATIRRVHIKLDPISGRPTPWTPVLREQLSALLRPAD
ncbi:MAG: acyl-CoA thioesterase [Acidimicrobiales bacterium]